MNSDVTMLTPQPPTIRKLDRISPTVYEAALKCTSRAAWVAWGDHSLLPPHPRALLGRGVHAVFERARSGGISGETETERRALATRLFDKKMDELFKETHSLLHAKFEVRERIPFYNLFRARAAQIAAELASASNIGATSAGVRGKFRESRISVETTLVSKDGRISGRPDVLDRKYGTVIDYKAGSPKGLDTLKRK